MLINRRIDVIEDKQASEIIYGVDKWAFNSEF